MIFFAEMFLELIQCPISYSTSMILREISKTLKASVGLGTCSLIIGDRILLLCSLTVNYLHSLFSSFCIYTSYKDSLFSSLAYRLLSRYLMAGSIPKTGFEKAYPSNKEINRSHRKVALTSVTGTITQGWGKSKQRARLISSMCPRMTSLIN